VPFGRGLDRAIIRQRAQLRDGASVHGDGHGLPPIAPATRERESACTEQPRPDLPRLTLDACGFA
jgi:hypothetical protein